MDAICSKILNLKRGLMMRYYLCCNQVKHCWEVRDRVNGHLIIFEGSLRETNEYIKIHN